MRGRNVVLGALLVLIGMAGIAWAEAERIGQVKTVTGEAAIVRGSERLSATPGVFVRLGDILETSKPGSLGVTLKDSTRLSLGPDARLELNEFVFAPADERFSFVTKLIRGTLFYISGVIAKLSPESVAIETPTATVGVRGTRFLVRVDE